MKALPDEGQQLLISLQHLCDNHRLIARYHKGTVWFTDEGAEALGAVCDYLECSPEEFVNRAAAHGLELL